MKRRTIQRTIGLFTFLVLVWNLTGTKVAFGQFFDDFTEGVLDQGKWIIFKTTPPQVSSEGLTLKGGDIAGDREEVQSVPRFLHGTLTTVIRSTSWREGTDSSCGFEEWLGGCHYAILFKPSGHLAIVESVPDVNGVCAGDPIRQKYIPLVNWAAVRAGGIVYLELKWSSDQVTLRVFDAMGNSDGVTYTQPSNPDPNNPALPQLPLKIRLNADSRETYTYEYILFTE